MSFMFEPVMLDPQKLRDFIGETSFPCVGAKSAVARGSLKVLVCRDITSAWDDLRIHSELMDWAKAYRRDPSGLRSLAIIFDGPHGLDETQFEKAMWERLQSLADKDAWLGQAFNGNVSPDPDDPHFSLSFGGEAYFVVGLHPNAARPARQFQHPAMVFNLHDQFVRLREKGKYERMRSVILERDRQLAGSINPMLARYGETSEARQYSGRLVDDQWQCPFKDPRS